MCVYAHVKSERNQIYMKKKFRNKKRINKFWRSFLQSIIISTMHVFVRIFSNLFYTDETTFNYYTITLLLPFIEHILCTLVGFSIFISLIFVSILYFMLIEMVWCLVSLNKIDNKPNKIGVVLFKMLNNYFCEFLCSFINLERKCTMYTYVLLLASCTISVQSASWLYFYCYFSFFQIDSKFTWIPFLCLNETQFI